MARGPELRTGAFYFAQFLSAGAASFSALWFSSLGFSPDQIGLLNAAPILAMLILNLIVGRIADRAKDWRQTIVVASIASAIIPVGLFFVSGFPGVLVFWAFTIIARQVTVPVADAATMRMCSRRGTSYSAIKAAGSIGLLCAIFATGYAIEHVGVAAFVPIFVFFGIMRAATALALPTFRGPASRPIDAGTAGSFRQLLTPKFLLPLTGYAMVFATHIVLGAFQALLFRPL